MSFRIEQKVGKHVYFYEVESYWDKSKKQPRQKRTFLGKKDPITGELISTHKGYSSLDYGNTYFLYEMAKQLNLHILLEQIFPDIWQELLTCVFFEISEKKALYLCKPWIECTHNIAERELSSQRISELLHDLGQQEEARFKFLKAWALQHDANEYIVFDITSFSSYAKKLDFLEWGYNRDREKLPQINFGVIYGEPSALPLFYTRYPGSIKDVSTLHNMVEYLEWLELSDTLFVLDRGFFSSYNLKKMASNMRFIIPLPYNNKNAVALIRKHKNDLALHSNAFRLNKQIMYGVKNRIEIGSKRYFSHLYLDEKRRVEERERFLNKVFELEKKVEEPGLCENIEELQGFLSDTVKGWDKIFEIIERDGKFWIKRKEKGINAQLEKMGTMILLSNKRLDGKEVLRLYRRKDVVEKFFDNMKHDIERKRLRIHTQETFEGRLFLDFLALIIYSKIGSVMRREGINKDFTVQELMYELKKIKLIRLGTKKMIVTEVSKKQRELFKSFNISVPTRP